MEHDSPGGGVRQFVSGCKAEVIGECTKRDSVRFTSVLTRIQNPREFKTPLVFEALEIKRFSVLEIMRDPTREYKTPLVFEGLENKGGFVFELGLMCTACILHSL